jgi:hypothetical protein
MNPAGVVLNNKGITLTESPSGYADVSSGRGRIVMVPTFMGGLSPATVSIGPDPPGFNASDATLRNGSTGTSVNLQPQSYEDLPPLEDVPPLLQAPPLQAPPPLMCALPPPSAFVPPPGPAAEAQAQHELANPLVVLNAMRAAITEGIDAIHAKAELEAKIKKLQEDLANKTAEVTVVKQRVAAAISAAGLAITPQ